MLPLDNNTRNYTRNSGNDDVVETPRLGKEDPKHGRRNAIGGRNASGMKKKGLHRRNKPVVTNQNQILEPGQQALITTKRPNKNTNKLPVIPESKTDSVVSTFEENEVKFNELVINQPVMVGNNASKITSEYRLLSEDIEQDSVGDCLDRISQMVRTIKFDRTKPKFVFLENLDFTKKNIEKLKMEYIVQKSNSGNDVIKLFKEDMYKLLDFLSDTVKKKYANCDSKIEKLHQTSFSLQKICVSSSINHEERQDYMQKVRDINIELQSMDAKNKQLLESQMKSDKYIEQYHNRINNNINSDFVNAGKKTTVEGFYSNKTTDEGFYNKKTTNEGPV